MGTCLGRQILEGVRTQSYNFTRLVKSRLVLNFRGFSYFHVTKIKQKRFTFSEIKKVRFSCARCVHYFESVAYNNYNRGLVTWVCGSIPPRNFPSPPPAPLKFR